MFDERFARQYRYKPPSEFPLTSPFTGIVHHLSGPNSCAHTQTSHNCLVGCWCRNIPAITFIPLMGLTTHKLAHMLDSLVRVSRRVEDRYIVSSSPAHMQRWEHRQSHEIAHPVLKRLHDHQRELTPLSKNHCSYREDTLGACFHYTHNEHPCTSSSLAK